MLAWGKSHKTQLGKLFVVQKRVIRIICNANFRAHTNPLFYDNQILKLEDVYYVQLGSLKGKFSSGIEGALASTLHHDFNWKQLSEMMLCIVILMFSKFICVILI